MQVTTSISIGFRKWTALNFLPPDHWPFSCTANDRAPALNAVWRFNGDHLDASGVNGKVVVEGWLIKIAVYGAKVGELGSATSQGIQAPASGRLARYCAERGNKNGNNGDPHGLRHIRILDIQFADGTFLKRRVIRKAAPRQVVSDDIL